MASLQYPRSVKMVVAQSDWPALDATLLWREPIPVRHALPLSRFDRPIPTLQE